MKIMTLNIRHGGGSRADSLVAYILRQRADIVVLTEWRAASVNSPIGTALRQNGFYLQTATRGPSNGILIATRREFTAKSITPEGSPKGVLLFAPDLDGINLVAAYFPNLAAKAPFFETCIFEAIKQSDAPFLLVGDLNTGRNTDDVDEHGTKFFCEDLFRDLSTRAGLHDLWRDTHPQRREWSWISSKKSGFRIDHAFGNKAFLDVFDFSCRYDHYPRTSGRLTDHSALSLECIRRSPRTAALF